MGLSGVDELLLNPADIRLVGTGALVRLAHGLRFVNLPTRGLHYSNAQIDDTTTQIRDAFRWRPPLTLTLRARFSHPAGLLTGTAGFGFWNDPFSMSAARRLTLPRALWFFYAAPPSDLASAVDRPGWGWKAMSMDALQPLFFALAPTAPAAILLMRLPALHRMLWPLAERSMALTQQLLDMDITQWHSYVLTWTERWAEARVDGVVVLQTRRPPRGPLGLVIWLDNQYMVVRPQGRVGNGVVVKTETEWMDVAELRIDGSGRVNQR